jgi:hypothetical protein
LSLTDLILELEVKLFVGQLPPWLGWESDSVLVGTPPTPDDGEDYKVPIALTAKYNAFGMSHTIDSRLELDIRSGSETGDLASSLQSVANLQSTSLGRGMEGGLEAYLDDMGYLAGQNPFSSETNTPPSAITPSMANPNHLLYVPSQSLQNPPLKQGPLAPTPPPSGPSFANMSINPLTPTLSPASLQYNPHVVGSTPHQSTSGPQTPLGGPPSQLSLQIPHQTHDSNQQNNLRFMNEAQPQMMYGLPDHTHLSPPASTESNGGGRIYGIDEELGDSNPMGHGYFDDSYPLELGSPFLER